MVARSGGTGRRSRLKICRSFALCGFDSLLRDQVLCVSRRPIKTTSEKLSGQALRVLLQNVFRSYPVMTPKNAGGREFKPQSFAAVTRYQVYPIARRLELTRLLHFPARACNLA